MFDRFSRSLELVKFSAGVLRKDKELLVFPLMSSIAAILVLISFMPLFVAGSGAATEMQSAYTGGAYDEDTVVQGGVSASGAVGAGDEFNLAIFALFYLVQYFVIFFFNFSTGGCRINSYAWWRSYCR